MRRFLISLVMLAALSGCGGDEHQELKQWMADSSKELKGRIPPLPQIKTFPVVAYDAIELLDPFSAKKLDAGKGSRSNNTGPKPDLNRRREPLEVFPLETLKMVGAMTLAGKPVAVVLADRTLYQASVGNYMGQNFGVVTKITESEITLKELIEDANGDWVERVSTLQLQDQEAKK